MNLWSTDSSQRQLEREKPQSLSLITARSMLGRILQTPTCQSNQYLNVTTNRCKGCSVYCRGCSGPGPSNCIQCGTLYSLKDGECQYVIETSPSDSEPTPSTPAPKPTSSQLTEDEITTRVVIFLVCLCVGIILIAMAYALLKSFMKRNRRRQISQANNEQAISKNEGEQHSQMNLIVEQPQYGQLIGAIPRKQIFEIKNRPASPILPDKPVHVAMPQNECLTPYVETRSQASKPSFITADHTGLNSPKQKATGFDQEQDNPRNNRSASFANNKPAEPAFNARPFSIRRTAMNVKALWGLRSQQFNSETHQI